MRRTLSSVQIRFQAAEKKDVPTGFAHVVAQQLGRETAMFKRDNGAVSRFDDAPFHCRSKPLCLDLFRLTLVNVQRVHAVPYDTMRSDRVDKFEGPV